jgi:hypothetical protein
MIKISMNWELREVAMNCERANIHGNRFKNLGCCLELREYKLRQNIVESFWGCDVPKEWGPSWAPSKFHDR